MQKNDENGINKCYYALFYFVISMKVVKNSL